MPMPTFLALAGASVIARDRHGQDLLSTSVLRRTTPGPWFGSQAAVMEPAGKNLVPNPSFELDLTGWSAVNATLNQSTEWAYAGSHSAKLDAPGSSPHLDLSITLTASTYSVSAWVYHEGTKTLPISLKYNGSQWGNFVYVRPGVPTRLVANNVPGVASAAAFSVSVSGTPDAPVFVDAVQIENTKTVTAYFDGSLGAGYSWTGSAHASPSQRTLNQFNLVTDGLVDAMRGSVALLLTAPASDLTGASGASGLYLSASGGTWQYLWFHGASVDEMVVGPAVTPGWHVVVLDWDGDTMGLSVDDAPRVTGPRGDYNGLLGPASLGIGNLSPSTNGPGGEFAVAAYAGFAVPLTAAERTALRRQVQPWTMTMLQPAVGAVSRVARSRVDGVVVPVGDSVVWDQYHATPDGADFDLTGCTVLAMVKPKVDDDPSNAAAVLTHRIEFDLDGQVVDATGYVLGGYRPDGTWGATAAAGALTDVLTASESRAIPPGDYVYDVRVKLGPDKEATPLLARPLKFTSHVALGAIP